MSAPELLLRGSGHRTQLGRAHGVSELCAVQCDLGRGGVEDGVLWEVEGY
jgi:hypothetical protein